MSVQIHPDILHACAMADHYSSASSLEFDVSFFPAAGISIKIRNVFAKLTAARARDNQSGEGSTTQHSEDDTDSAYDDDALSRCAANSVKTPFLQLRKC
jgi:hypothetical protein